MHSCDTQFEQVLSQSHMHTVTSSNGQRMFCLIVSQLCYVTRVILIMSEMYDRHTRLRYTHSSLSSFSLPLFVFLSLLFSLLSAVDKLLALASVSLRLRISKLEPYLYNVKSAQTTVLVPRKSCFKGIPLIHDAFVLPSAAPYGN